MASRDYPRLGIEDFGRQLLTTGDLDPVYLALHRCQSAQLFSHEQLCRWLVAYWCFYDCGFASWLSERKGETFWEQMSVAAANNAPTPMGGRWPRGKERRHFRGQQGIQAVMELWKRYAAQPEAMVSYIANDGSPSKLEDIFKRAQEHRGFGDWISFKVADMLNRVLQVPIDFDNATVFMFADPRKAALMLYRQKEKLTPEAPIADENAAITKVLGYLGRVFKDFKAAPDYVRGLNVQEYETVLCKWKSHCNGHYPPKNDIHEINEGVRPWTKCSEAARNFLTKMPT